MITLALAGLVVACCGCAVALALALRVKQITSGVEVRAPRGTDVEIGAVVPGFHGLTDLDGLPWERLPAGGEPWLLAFLSPECPGCSEQLPRYIRHLRHHGISAERAVSVMVGDEVNRDSLSTDLLRSTQVVRASATSALVLGLNISSWPTYLIVDGEGKVAYATQSVSRLVHIDPRLPEHAVAALAIP
ncbi:TlpA family protein disulfide reductase [Streptomyces coelicoflavus]|uniref:TlpA family protein disulfide reductase n=1 Tax=Streptomyces coelicoflavus TaxID=285562 RepID=UPI003F4A61D0